MSRLSSLRGPSTPSPASSRASPLPQTSSPTSPNNARLVASHDPTPFHRKLRATLVDIEKGLRDWEEIVLMDGLRAAKGCVDCRTGLDNLTVSLTNPYPYAPTASSLLVKLVQSQHALNEVLSKLSKRLIKLTSLSDTIESLLVECTRLKGPTFAKQTALWTTWSLDRFALSLDPLLALLHHSHSRLTTLSHILISPSTPFSTAKSALEAWQREGHWEGSWASLHLLPVLDPDEEAPPAEEGKEGVSGKGEGGMEWRREWEEIMDVEVKAWESCFGTLGRGI